MEWYPNQKINGKSDDLVVPDSLKAFEYTGIDGIAPSQDDWCHWEVIQSKDIGSQNGYHVTPDVSSVNRHNLYGQVGHLSMGCSSVSSCGQPSLMDYITRDLQLDVELEDDMEKMDDIFCDSFLEEDEMFPDFVAFEDPLANMESDFQIWSDSSRWGNPSSINSCSFPMFMDHKLEDGSKFEDGSPCPTLEEYKRPEGSPADDVASATNKIYAVSDIDEPKCFKATVLSEFEDVMIQLTEKTRICFRDALYRLGKSSEQGHATHHSKSMSCSDKPDTRNATGGISRKRRSNCMESSTNAIDRTVAKLMYNKACCDPSGLLFA